MTSHDPRPQYTAPVSTGSEETAQARKALETYIEWHGALHDDGCPEDDTCDCSTKWVNDGINAAHRLLSKPAPASCPHVWQPIATAPKDGPRVLLFAPSSRKYPIKVGCWIEYPNGYSGWQESVGSWSTISATHWMPLPAPPASPSPKGGE